jgi:hypothetical protein
MKSTGLWAAIGIGIFITVGLIAVEQGYAEDNKQAPTCTLETLKGRYLFGASGTLLPPAFGVTQQSLASTAGYHIFNGDGTGTDIVTFRINGVTVLENEVVPITYTVNEDCTGAYTANVPNGPSFGIFIAPTGEELITIATNPGQVAVFGPSRRVSRK